MVRSQNLTIHLPSDAVIASGAVDFYLAGRTRTREAGSKIGVHAWSDGASEATDFPVGHSRHQAYINLLPRNGVLQSRGRSFLLFYH